MPREYPLAFFEMSFLLPHFLKEARGKLAMYFTRVYNPVWTNPDGMSWIEMLTDEAKVERHACLTPTWSETAWFADYVLPMGHASERHDLMSQETHAARWIGFRQPVLRVALEKQGKTFDHTWQAHEAAGLGQVWEEDEFWIELSWRIDPDGSLGIRKYFESPYRPGEKLRIEEFYRWIFEHSVPGLPAAAAARGADPARLHAQVRRVPGPGQRLRHARDVADPGRARGRRRRRRLAPGHEGRRVGGRGGGRAVDGRLPHALAQARVLLEDPQGLEVAGARGADLRPQPRALVRDRPGPGRDGAPAHLPAADPDPLALRQRQVALRDLPQQPAVAQSRGRGALRGQDRRPPEGHHRDRPLRGPGVGDRGDPARRARLLASPGPLAALGADRGRALVHRAREPRPDRRPASGASGTCTGCGRSRAAIPTRSGCGGRTRACTRT